MTKKKIGWLIVGIVVVAVLGFVGYQFYQEKAIENRKETARIYNSKLSALYLDQKDGYFKSNLSQADFNQLIDELNQQGGQKDQMVEKVTAAKHNFNLQTRMNELFESPVLDGMDLSAHPILQAPDEQGEITKLENLLKKSNAQEKNWGKDVHTILNLAADQSTQYDTATTTVRKITRKKVQNLTLQDYLTGVQAVAVLPAGTYKEQLLNQLDPAKEKLSEGNQDFSNEIEQKEADIQAAAEEYQARQTKELEAKSDQLATLKKELTQKQQTYASLARVKSSLEASKNKAKSSDSKEDSSNSRSSTSTTRSSSSSQSSSQSASSSTTSSSSSSVSNSSSESD